MLKLATISSLLVAISFVGVACTAQNAYVKPDGCAPVDELAMTGVDGESLAGAYELVLVATAGDLAGNSTTGGLQLQPNEPGLRGIPSGDGGTRTDSSAPLYGTTDVDVTRVGGLRLGEPTSSDPTRPGVLLVQKGEGIVLRIGSETNRRGVLRFDGGYFAMRVRRVDQKGFAGSWTSGIAQTQAEGHFCAYRLDAGAR